MHVFYVVVRPAVEQGHLKNISYYSILYFLHKCETTDNYILIIESNDRAGLEQRHLHQPLVAVKVPG